MDTVGRIFDLLDKTTMEQKEFARLVGVSDDTASDWRRRRSNSYSRPARLTKIAEVLNTTVEYLLTGEQKEKSETLSGSGLSEGEELLISLFRMLSQEDKDAVLRVVRAAANGKRSPE